MPSTKLTIYVAGPIANTTDYHERFAAGCEALYRIGHEPVNPLLINPNVANTIETWRECMKMDIKALLDCDGIYMLRGWQKSKGATLEKHIAETLGMVVLFQDEER